MVERVYGNEAEAAFYEKIFLKYLYEGTVGGISKDTPGVSFADLHRKLRAAGIVKSPLGPRASLSELIFFFTNFVEAANDPRETANVATFYKRFPPNMSVPIETVWRVHNTVTSGFRDEQIGRTKRHAVGLLISPRDDSTQILVGNDIGIARLGYGKRFDDVSLPMGFSGKPGHEDSRTSILRVLQREVWPNFAARGVFGPDSDLAARVIPEKPEFLGELVIVDTGVMLYRLELDRELCQPELFYPLKLRDHRFVEVGDVANGMSGMRTGMTEMAGIYTRKLQLGEGFEPGIDTALLNQRIVEVAINSGQFSNQAILQAA